MIFILFLTNSCFADPKKRPPPPPPSLIPPSSALKPSDLNGPITKFAAYEETVFVPEDYSLSFDITPTGTYSEWSSIIHYSGDKTDMGPKGRIPCIFSIKIY